MTSQQRAEQKPVKTAPVGQASARTQPGCGSGTAGQPVGDEPLAPQALLQAVIDALPLQILVIDRDFRILLANDLARQANVAATVSDGLTCHRLTHRTETPCRGAGVRCPAEEAFRTGRPETVTHTHRDAQGTEYIAEVTATPIRDRTGNVARVVVSSHDVTQGMFADQERAGLEARLNQAQKMEAVGRLAGRIAHEFNNILTTMLGNVELMTTELEGQRPPDDPLRSRVAQIDRAAQRAAVLTQRLLALSRHQVAKPQMLDPNQLIREMEDLLRSLLDERIAFDLSLEPGLHAVYADPAQIEQIVMSLVLNAREAISAPGKLSLETADVMLDGSFVKAHPGATAGPHVMIAVSDTGQGMDEDTRRRVIEPFFVTRPNNGRESGLGLSAVYSAVKQANGYVTLESEPDRGTTFRVYLPVTRTPPASR